MDCSSNRPIPAHPSLLPPPMALVARASLIPLDDFLGTWLIGLILSSVRDSRLFGVTCLQIFLYFTKYCSRDRGILKIFVLFLFALDAFHLALVSHSLYSVVVTNFGDYVQLGIAPWSLLIQTVVGILLGTLVQFFYGWRIYVISKKSVILPVMIGICSTTCFVFGAIYTHKSFVFKFFKLAERLVVWSAIGLGFGAAADLLIAGTMIYYLLKSKTGFRKTNRAINILVAYSLSTGALTSVFAIGDVIAGSVAPSSLDHVPFFFILIRLHFLSFMSILNSRNHVREQFYAGDHAMVTIPSYPAATNDIENGTNSDMKVSGGRSGVGFTDSTR
ncbi:hypothetical protein R3P38DRAFT_1708376 [Favolaschia claudopus]|uniref:DUF6534 domain-containing protein n=1 Tax=Favolaschia claudopus TaxID=2862362 RepID=A0AAW0AB84_9AGAR